MLNHLFCVLSDWIDMWVDVIAIHFCDWCDCHILVLFFVTDVIVTLMLVYCLEDVVPCGVVPPLPVARGYFFFPWLMLLPLWFVRLMLLPYVQCSWLMLLPVHVWLMLLPWWLMLNPPMGVLADIIAKVAWWNSHWVNFLILILMF